MSARQIPKVTPAEYLAAERAAEHRSEFVDGEVFAMSGGSRTHAALISRVAREFEDALEDSPCEVAVSDLRLQVAPEGAYLYPDVIVACGIETADPDDMISNPSVVVEVLSPSTERWDRVGKFAQYRRVASLREYVLVSQEEARIEWYTRRDDGAWVYAEVNGLDAVCRLEVSGVLLSLGRIYRKVEGRR
jgi:Uma2 family endonuclease